MMMEHTNELKAQLHKYFQAICYDIFGIGDTINITGTLKFTVNLTNDVDIAVEENIFVGIYCKKYDSEISALPASNEDSVFSNLDSIDVPNTYNEKGFPDMDFNDEGFTECIQQM